MRYDEVWSYSVDRIQEYFDLADDRGCTIELEAMPERKMGIISFPQTRVVIDGDDAEQVYHGFYLHFLSGGA